MQRLTPLNRMIVDLSAGVVVTVKFAPEATRYYPKDRSTAVLIRELIRDYPKYEPVIGPLLVANPNEGYGIIHLKRSIKKGEVKVSVIPHNEDGLNPSASINRRLDIADAIDFLNLVNGLTLFITEDEEDPLNG